VAIIVKEVAMRGIDLVYLYREKAPGDVPSPLKANAVLTKARVANKALVNCMMITMAIVRYEVN